MLVTALLSITLIAHTLFLYSYVFLGIGSYKYLLAQDAR